MSSNRQKPENWLSGELNMAVEKEKASGHLE
jgi:hypothetical protein